MKANEAPEKIYRTTTYLGNDKGKTLWKKQPVAGAENIEYTRTDASVEKAVEWLKENAADYVVHHWNETMLDTMSLVEDFQNYLEGKMICNINPYWQSEFQKL